MLVATTSILVQSMRKGLLERLKLKLRSKGGGIHHEAATWEERKVGGCIVFQGKEKNLQGTKARDKFRFTRPWSCIGLLLMHVI